MSLWHCNKTPPRRTWKGRKRSMPTNRKGGLLGVTRFSGRSAIFWEQSGACQCLQLTHFERTSLDNRTSISYPKFRMNYGLPEHLRICSSALNPSISSFVMVMVLQIPWTSGSSWPRFLNCFVKQSVKNSNCRSRGMPP